MKNKQLTYLLKDVGIAGNGMFFLWMLYNGITEGFEGTIVEKISYIGLGTLLLYNIYVMLPKKGRKAETEEIQ